MKGSWIFAVGLALVGIPAMASAQTGRISLEGRGGLAFPTDDLEDLGADAGFAAGLDLMYNVNPWLTLYGGGSRSEFDGGFSSTGLQAGAKLIGLENASVLPWVAGGVLAQTLRANGEESDMEVGFEAGAGADFAVSDRFSLTPSVRYRNFDASVNGSDLSTQFFVVSLGAHLHLGR